mmetsp:Transcript_97344/g.231609  ORF Transcript_97344/g.231609 Transcript_97344/m.231609 type:complete len:300 (+) Transcript_97344:59-958(+)
MDDTASASSQDSPEFLSGRSKSQEQLRLLGSMAEEVQTVSEKLLELARASADSEMVEAAAREAREVHQLLSSELTRLSGDWQDLGRSACVGSLRRSLDNRSLVNLGNISTQESLNWRRHPELARLFGKSGDISTRSVLNSTLTDASEILEGLSRRRELRRQLRKLRQALAEAQAASEARSNLGGSDALGFGVSSPLDFCASGQIWISSEIERVKSVSDQLAISRTVPGSNKVLRSASATGLGRSSVHSKLRRGWHDSLDMHCYLQEQLRRLKKGSDASRAPVQDLRPEPLKPFSIRTPL